MIYPAITLWQPWATLVAEEAKPLEFRSWPAPPDYVGKRVAVHAGARPLRRVEVQDLLLRLHGKGWRTTGLIREKAIPALGVDPHRAGADAAIVRRLSGHAGRAGPG